MHHFAYRNGVLHAEGVDLIALAEAVGTPFYCYASATLERHYNVFAGAFADVDALVCYSLKANSNQAVVATLGQARRRRRRRLRRRIVARPRRRNPAAQDHVLRRRQDRARA